MIFVKYNSRLYLLLKKLAMGIKNMRLQLPKLHTSHDGVGVYRTGGEVY